MYRLAYSITLIAICFSFSSCDSEEEFDYIDTVPLTSIEVNDVIVGPDVITVHISESSNAFIQAINLTNSSDTMEIDVDYRYCTSCGGGGGTAEGFSIYKEGVKTTFDRNSIRIDMDDWPVTNGTVYLGYLNTQGSRTYQAITVRSASTIASIVFDPPLPAAGDTMWLDLSGTTSNCLADMTLTGFCPILGSNIDGSGTSLPILNEARAYLWRVNGTQNAGCGGYSQTDQSGNSYDTYQPDQHGHVTELSIVYTLGGNGDWRLLADTVFNVDFHTAYE